MRALVDQVKFSMAALTIDLAIAKTNKHASRESGDTAELVERPGGGLSVVLADGQGSGRAAKSLSLLVTSKAVSLLKEGVRDGAAARGVHDYLFTYRHGQVSATLDILSVDLATSTILITRNSETPLIVGRSGEITCILGGAGPIGRYHLTRPVVTQIPVEPWTLLLLVTDGVLSSGHPGSPGEFDIRDYAASSLAEVWDASKAADILLREAIRRDDGRPRDDLTVVALVIRPHDEKTLIRRMSAVVPVSCAVGAAIGGDRLS